MKLVRYLYVDGNNTPSDIILGGFFPHSIDGSKYLIGLVNDDNAREKVMYNELFSITNGYTKMINYEMVYLNEEERIQYLDSFLSFLSELGYNISL